MFVTPLCHTVWDQRRRKALKLYVHHRNVLRELWSFRWNPFIVPLGFHQRNQTNRVIPPGTVVLLILPRTIGVGLVGLTMCDWSSIPNVCFVSNPTFYLHHTLLKSVNFWLNCRNSCYCCCLLQSVMVSSCGTARLRKNEESGVL